VPGTVWLLLVAGVLVALIEAVTAFRTHQWRRFGWVVLWNLAYPPGLWALLSAMPATDWPMPLQILLALAIVVPLGPMVYRLRTADRRGAGAEPADRLGAVHVVMLGLGLLMFGAEGSRTPPFSEGNLQFGALSASAQSLWSSVARSV